MFSFYQWQIWTQTNCTRIYGATAANLFTKPLGLFCPKRKKKKLVISMKWNTFFLLANEIDFRVKYLGIRKKQETNDFDPLLNHFGLLGHYKNQSSTEYRKPGCSGPSFELFSNVHFLFFCQGCFFSRFSIESQLIL